MDILMQVLCGVILAQLLHIIHVNRKNKARFEKIDRAVFGEDDINNLGMIKKINCLSDSLKLLSTELTNVQHNLRSHVVESNNDSDSLNNHGVSIGKIINDINDLKTIINTSKRDKDKITYTQEIIINDMIAKSLKTVWVELNKKSNRETVETEIKYIIEKISDLGNSLKDKK